MCFIGAADERKKGLSIKVPLKAFLSMFSQNSGNENRAQVPKENVASCINCFQFAVTWSLLVNGFLQVIPFPFKSGRKNFQKSDEDKLCSCMKPTISSCEVKQNERKVKEIIMITSPQYCGCGDRRNCIIPHHNDVTTLQTIRRGSHLVGFREEVFGLKLPLLDIPAGSVLRSALAGGLSCALSCSLLHPVDSFKTRVQASTMSFPEIIAQLPQIGARAMAYELGYFEASKLVLINFAPTLPELQDHFQQGSLPAVPPTITSLAPTFLGTAARIPCEVLKQRLQAGLFDNVGEALVATWQQDGLKGFFRGTGATLCHEVPFYVAGMGLCAESKKGVQQLLGRELEAWKQ
ncbi:hypothetical protein Lal_00000219 [Lupinus albus]|nr:hypothetical protein Lal_00000219 [Lupinus albus]